jgi:hypothetical protein
MSGWCSNLTPILAGIEKAAVQTTRSIYMYW